MNDRTLKNNIRAWLLAGLDRRAGKDSEGTRFAAMPLDVRKGCALPELTLLNLGLRPRYGRSPKWLRISVRWGRATTAHRAA